MTPDDVQAFKTHRLWESALDAVKFAENAQGRSPADRNTLARVVAVGRYVRSFRPIEPYLFTVNRLQQADAITAQFDAINSQLRGWDQKAAMLPNTVGAIDSVCDQILTYVADFRWPTPRRGRESDDLLAQTADAYRGVAESSLNGLAMDVDSAEERLAGLQQRIMELDASAISRENDAQEALEQIRKALTDQAQAAQAELANLTRQLKDAAAKQREGFEQDAAKYLKSLEDNYNAGNELVKKVADQSVGGEYLKFAELEKSAYRLWSGAGVLAGAGAFIYLAVMFKEGGGGLEGSILKVGISLTLVALSVYAFREAGKRLRQSVEARYRAMDVIAMPPFSRDLTEDQKSSLRYLMGERLFGSSIETSQSSRGDKNSNFSLSVDAATVKALADAVKSVRDASSS